MQRFSSDKNFATFFSEFGTEKAIHQNVCGRIQDQKKMTDADGNHGPYGKRMMSLFPAHHGFLNGDQFMNVEKKPRKKK